MQNRKRPVGIVRFATPDNRKPHTQVKTHRLRILFIDIDRISSLAGDGPLHQLASAASAPVFGPNEQHGDMTSVQTDERHDTPRIPAGSEVRPPAGSGQATENAIPEYPPRRENHG